MNEWWDLVFLQCSILNQTYEKYFKNTTTDDCFRKRKYSQEKKNKRKKFCFVLIIANVLPCVVSMKDNSLICESKTLSFH